MKKYSVFCNMCGREIKAGLDQPGEEMLSVEKRWGYFSEKDEEVHSFDLCEQCYDALISRFEIPITIRKQTELL